MSTTRTKHTISDEGAKQVLAAAEAKARSIDVPMVIAVLDDGGHLSAFLRMDGAPIPSIGVATDKAWTAAGFGLPTDQWYDAIKDEPQLLHGVGAVPRFMLMGGGYPLQRDGQTIGAIGVSGGSYQQDMEVAQAGVAALD